MQLPAPEHSAQQVSLIRGALTDPPVQGQDRWELHTESCTAKGLGLDFTEVFKGLPSLLSAQGMLQVSSAAAGKQIPLSYF